MHKLALIQRAEAHVERVAFRSEHGDCTYRELLDLSWAVARQLLGNEKDLSEARIAFLMPGGVEYAAVQWAIWQAGGCAVPLSLSATEPELEYVLTDSEVSSLITSRKFYDGCQSLADRLGIRLLTIEDLLQPGKMTGTAQPDLPAIDDGRRAMILYTSGTTSRPKGVVTTHANIHAQIEALVTAWQWQATDSIPLFLPMHHVHGIINVMSCALWSGAAIEPFPEFDPVRIIDRVADHAYSIFMAVPTIYVKLIQTLADFLPEDREPIAAGFRSMRLMVSGSAALSASLHKKWQELTGQQLLERYGMTEIGMALSNPYVGERRPGAVGTPLPGVQIRLIDEHDRVITADGEAGEIQVQGPAVFREYWRKPEVTADSFFDGWFKTGDTALVENGYYRILGRQSVDIIKSGGYKLSALEIEAVLSEHPVIKEVAVVGLPDETWGEAVAAAVVLHSGQELNVSSLREWCRNRLSKYKIPKHLLVTEYLPRNAMGKVTKPAVRELFVR